MKYVILNNFAQVLAGSLAASTTDAAETMTLNGGGSLLEAAIVNGTAHALLTLVEVNSDNEEIAWEVVEVTGATGNELNILRGQDGTEAVAWASGVPVEMRVTTKLMNAFAFTDDLPPEPDLAAYYSPATDLTVLGGILNDTTWGDLSGPDDATNLPKKIVITSQDTDSISFTSYNTPNAEALAGPALAIQTNRFGSIGVPLGGVNVGVDTQCTDFSVMFGRGGQAGDSDGGVSLGIGNWSGWGNTMAVGSFQYAYDFSCAIGTGWMDYNTVGYADEEYGYSAANYEEGGAYSAMSLSLGFVTNANGAWSIGLGARADSNAGNGLRCTAISYISEPYSTFDFNVEDIGGDPTPWYTQPNATKHAASQIAVSLPPINLSQSAGTQIDLQLGGDLALFIDSIELVVRSAGDITGSPAISLGTATGTPANVLAATAITDLTQYSRQIETPLIANGVLNLVAEITTAGTGTEGELYVVVKGFAMEAV